MERRSKEEEALGVLWLIVGCLFHMLGVTWLAWACWAYGCYDHVLSIGLALLSSVEKAKARREGK
jgi:hypothetical protein